MSNLQFYCTATANHVGLSALFGCTLECRLVNSPSFLIGCHIGKYITEYLNNLLISDVYFL